MNLKELINIVHGELLNNYKDVNIISFSTDTRTLNNDVFIALRGTNFDGHDFINNDISASIVISEKNIVLKDIPVIKVNSNYDTLYYLSKYFIGKYNVGIVGITGSCGKTTLKELIYDILSVKYKVLKNEGNKNNIIGLFDTLKNLDSSYDVCVLEMGMNHKGELSQLSKMINPSIGVITNIGSAHIGNFRNKKEIFKAKMEITDGLMGDLIVNGDDKYLKKVKAYKCGCNLNNDLIAYNVNIYNDLLTFNIYLDKEYLISFKIPSKYYISSILEAIKVGLYYNIDIIGIIECIDNFEILDKRLKMTKIDNYYLIDDSYNASYESIRCGLNLLQKINNDKIVILGDMLELGKYSKKYHKKINRLLRKINNKIVLTIGNNTKYINGIHFDSINDMIKYLEHLNLENKYIYIKGSRKMKLDRIVNELLG